MPQWAKLRLDCKDPVTFDHHLLALSLRRTMERKWGLQAVIVPEGESTTPDIHILQNGEVVAAVEMKTKEDLKDPSPGMPFPTAQKLVKRALDDSADQLRPPLPGMLAIGARPRAALDVDYVANPSYAGTLEYVEPLG